MGHRRPSPHRPLRSKALEDLIQPAPTEAPIYRTALARVPVWHAEEPSPAPWHQTKPDLTELLLAELSLPEHRRHALDMAPAVRARIVRTVLEQHRSP